MVFSMNETLDSLTKSVQEMYDLESNPNLFRVLALTVLTRDRRYRGRIDTGEHPVDVDYT